MINEVVKSWDANKGSLKERLRSMTEYITYEDLMKVICEEITSKMSTDGNWNVSNYEKFHTINDGDYQGDLGFLLIPNTYQPDISRYIVTHQSYGSCSGCDLLEGILSDNRGDKDKIVSDLITLCLHLIQRMKYIGDFEYTED